MIRQGSLIPGGGLAPLTAAVEAVETVAAHPVEAALVARARSGDREAFAELVDRHQDGVVAYLARLTGDRDRAEDLAQETFLRFYRSLGAYREEGQLKAYLFRIGANLVRSEERRKRRFHVLLPFLSRAGHDEPAGPAGMLRDELHGLVAAAIARLPLRFRVPLVLHEIEGWQYDEIARDQGCREGTVKSRVHRGRQMLRRALEPYWNGEGRWKTKTSAG